MSGLTVELLEGRPSKRRPTKWWARFGVIADRLVAAYGTPVLGNQPDPIDEIFYILLAAKTTDVLYRRTHAALRSRFPTVDQLCNASVEEIARCIQGGGIGNLKASRIHRIANTITAELGNDPSGKLKRMTASEAYTFLAGLPGLGSKSALCVMMCSLGHDVFPVDVNVSRMAVRLGAVPAHRKHYHYQKLLPPLVPDGRSKELHVGMVVHGRTVCVPRNPKCDGCLIRYLCKYWKKRQSKPSVGDATS